MIRISAARELPPEKPGRPTGLPRPSSIGQHGRTMRRMNDPDRDPRQILLQLDATLAAVGELLTALTSASHKLDGNRRAGWLEALDALWRFLDTLDTPDLDRTKVPIATLMAALRDLDHGKVDRGLRPECHGRGRVPDGYDQLVTRAIAAAAMDFLVRAGRSKPAAAKAVARALHKLGVQIGGVHNTDIEKSGQTVGDWRERLDRGKDQPTALAHYRSFKKKFGFPPGFSIDSVEKGLPIILSEALAGRIDKSNAIAKPVEGSRAHHDGPDAPPVGTVENGYRYIGGDPDEQSSWEAVR
jgi:hypothetical protein